MNKKPLPGLKEKRYQQKKEIIGYLYKSEELSKPEICRLTKMTTPTISRIINELIDEGWVQDLGQGDSMGGKRPHIFALHPNAAYIMGVDLGRSHIRIAIFDLRKNIIGEIKKFPSILETHSKEDTLEYIYEKIEESLTDLKIPRNKIKVAGFSIPGLIDCEGNTFTYLEYENPNIQEKLEKKLGIPVFIDNDSQVMAMAEHSFGIAARLSDVLCICVNECVGMGMILNGQPYTGHKGMAGEFGHIRISGYSVPCSCGKIGCLEAIASGKTMIEEAKAKLKEDPNISSINKYLRNGDITIDSIIESANNDDMFAIELLQSTGEKIGEGLAYLIHIFNPELIVVGGNVAEADELIIAPIKQSLNKYTLTRLKNQCSIAKSNLGSKAAIMGTLMLVMKHLYYEGDSNFSLY